MAQEGAQRTERESLEKIHQALIRHAADIAREAGATAVLAYVDVVRSREALQELFQSTRCILAARDENVISDLVEMGGPEDRVILVPYMKLTRVSQVKVAAMLALAKGLIRSEDRVVCLSGSPRHGVFDNLTILDVNREFELFAAGELEITSHLGAPPVFERLVTIALELAEEGKEGKPLGTTFVLGDEEKVMGLSRQMVINPFSGVPEEERNVMDPRLKETIREFATIDGAFIVRTDGVILAAGRHLTASTDTPEIAHGLGSRHRSAAGISSVTNAVAIVLSESTGDVRIFSGGRMFMEIEKGRRD